jgi:hypothetical protein
MKALLWYFVGLKFCEGGAIVRGPLPSWENMFCNSLSNWVPCRNLFIRGQYWLYDEYRKVWLWYYVGLNFYDNGTSCSPAKGIWVIPCQQITYLVTFKRGCLSPDLVHGTRDLLSATFLEAYNFSMDKDTDQVFGILCDSGPGFQNLPSESVIWPILSEIRGIYRNGWSLPRGIKCFQAAHFLNLHPQRWKKVPMH